MKMRRTTELLVHLWRPAAVVLLLGMSPSHSAAAHYEDVVVTAQPQPTSESVSRDVGPSGYIEQRIVVANSSKTDDHRVRLIFPSSPARYRGGSLAEDSRTVQVARESTAAVSIFVPPVGVSGNDIAVEIDGVRQRDFVTAALPFPTRFSGYAEDDWEQSRAQNILASRDITQEYKDSVRTEHGDSISFYRSELAVAQWSSNWLGYTCYSAVLLTEHEAAMLPAEVAVALRRYAEAGGTVLIRGASNDVSKVVPESLRGQASGVAKDGLYHVGFGLVGVATDQFPYPELARAKPPLMPNSSQLQVVERVTVPVRGLLMLTTVFAVGMGPINLWILARRNKRMWLWWNVPAVSVATCLLVFVYSLFSDGWGTRSRAIVMTMLDENTHRATTLGYISFYCPLTPPGLHFTYDTEVTPLQDGERRNFSGMSRSVPDKYMDWTSDQHLKSGWVVSRIPAVFAVRKSESRRERLPIRLAADGTPTVVNGLGTPIETLYYMGSDGAVYSATGLTAGQEQTLARQDSLKRYMPPGNSELWRPLFVQDWAVSLNSMKDRPERYMAPGTYLAVVRNSPFIENPLEGASYQGGWGIICGVSARSADGR